MVTVARCANWRPHFERIAQRLCDSPSSTTPHMVLNRVLGLHRKLPEQAFCVPAATNAHEPVRPIRGQNARFR